MKLNYFSVLSFIGYLTFGQAGSESPITNINGTIPYQGYDETTPLLGSGQYKIYYDNVDGVLDKPIFFIDGFDPNDSRDIPALYSLLDYGNPVQNLGELIRNEGFDLVVLNFEASYASPTDGSTLISGGADYIQRNAFTLIELINTINGMKVGTEENVVIGPSMGGLIAQYALRYMEQNSIDHQTRLFISFDAPHRGANVPIGIQYLFNYMVNGDPGLTEVQPFVDGFLNSPAAKQMLIDHYLGHVDASGFQQDASTHTPKGAPNFRTAFQNELDAMGFPQTVRNVAITNGSGSGQMNGSPGLELINYIFDTGPVSFPPFGNINTQAIMSIHFTPAANQNIEVTNFVGQGQIFGFWVDVFTYAATAESGTNSDGLDSAPGGQFDMYSFDDGTNPMITEFVSNLNSQYFNFIPTLSGLAISNENDWYANPNVNDSPFVNTYIPSNNEPHVTLTDGNVLFALEEIFGETLGSLDFLNPYDIQLKNNPVEDSFTLTSSQFINNANIVLYDMTGKLVLEHALSIDNQTTIPIDLDGGMYLLNVNTDRSTFKTKIVVK